MGNVEKYLIGITEDCSFDINSRMNVRFVVLIACTRRALP